MAIGPEPRKCWASAAQASIASSSERANTHPGCEQPGCRFSLHAQVEDHSAITVRVLLHSHGEEADLQPTLFEVLCLERTDSRCTLAAIKLQNGRVWPVGLLTEEHEADDIP
jgi:hypothetical protein